MEEKIIDIKIYQGTSMEDLRPRRINEGDCNIEWNRNGIEFKKCPNGIFCPKNVPESCFEIGNDTFVQWNKLIQNGEERIQYQLSIDGNVRYTILVIKRTIEEWLKWNSRVSNNINTEVMWQLAQIEEWKWSPKMAQKDIKDSFDNLQNNLPQGVDDNVRKLILDTWKRRYISRLSKDMLYPSEDVSPAVNAFKTLLYQTT